MKAAPSSRLKWQLKCPRVLGYYRAISFFCHVIVLLASSCNDLFQHSGIKHTQTVNNHLYKG